ncbi:NADH-quinone oxidoreductase subunit J [Bacillus sp. es.036]|uniref:NADH-quinone oxidoreductase subunit J n=1 Tax=Bacillus sp. es.036 TaxID=1761764 RepID=UPI000BF8D00A|nr:NADH-quinone oxidoreductase subunit J [Bacillus sp. es.036]PFG15175.1 NADH-quinone oxidoreductase subunit J [Bacillus sp. es.036]
MTGELLIFIFLFLITMTGGLLMINLSKVIHMMMALVLTFLGIAGLYIMLSAEFVAVVQILIYSGAITIIMLFGIMLTKHSEEEPKTGWAKKGIVLTVITAFFLIVFKGIRTISLGPQAEKLHENNTEQVGLMLFTDYVIPFELVSVVLLVALVGAIILAKKDDEEGEKP